MSFCQARKASIQSSNVAIFFIAHRNLYHSGLCRAESWPMAAADRLGRPDRRLREPLAADHPFLRPGDGRRRAGARARRRAARADGRRSALRRPAARRRASAALGDLEEFLGAMRGRGVPRGTSPRRFRAPGSAAAYRETLLRYPKEEARFFQFKEHQALERAQAWLTGWASRSAGAPAGRVTGSGAAAIGACRAFAADRSAGRACAAALVRRAERCAAAALRRRCGVGVASGALLVRFDGRDAGVVATLTRRDGAALEGGRLRGVPLAARSAGGVLRVRGQSARRALRRAGRVAGRAARDDARGRRLELPGLLGAGRRGARTAGRPCCTIPLRRSAAKRSTAGAANFYRIDRGRPERATSTRPGARRAPIRRISTGRPVRLAADAVTQTAEWSPALSSASRAG